MKLYYTVVVFVLPIIMFFSGMAWRKAGPRKINRAFGYRTARSMKNQETWQFAHRYVGRIWVACGKGLAVASLVGLLVFWGKSEEVFGIAATALILGQLAVLLLAIPLTERELARQFDRDGKRRQP